MGPDDHFGVCRLHSRLLLTMLGLYPKGMMGRCCAYALFAAVRLVLSCPKATNIALSFVKDAAKVYWRKEMETWLMKEDPNVIGKIITRCLLSPPLAMGVRRVCLLPSSPVRNPGTKN